MKVSCLLSGELDKEPSCATPLHEPMTLGALITGVGLDGETGAPTVVETSLKPFSLNKMFTVKISPGIMVGFPPKMISKSCAFVVLKGQTQRGLLAGIPKQVGI